MLHACAFTGIRLAGGKGDIKQDLECRCRDPFVSLHDFTGNISDNMHIYIHIRMDSTAYLGMHIQMANTNPHQ